MTTFEGAYSRAVGRRKDVSPKIASLLRELHSQACARPLNRESLKQALIELLEFLATPEGKTNSNCWTVDLFCCSDDWEIGWEDLPEDLVDILGDMGGALHDTVQAPEIAHNLDSTPEQLLDRARKL